MELTTREMPLDYLQRTVLETICQEQTAELAVPDGLPDIERVLTVTGLPVLQEKHCENGELRLSGGVQAAVVYLPVGESTPQRLEGWLPFTVRKNGNASTGCLIEQTWLRSIDARRNGERRVTVRANLGTKLELLQPERLTVKSVEPPTDGLQLRRATYPVQLPVGCTEKEFRVEEELILPETVPAIERILSWELRPTIGERRMIGNKAVFQGEIVAELLYLGADGSVNTFVGAAPYSQYAELEGEWPDATPVIFPAITSAQLETDGQLESRTLLLELGLLAQVCVIDRVELELIEDAYAPKAVLEPVWQEISLQPLLDRQTLRQTPELTVPAKAAQVVALSATVDQPSQRRSGESVRLCAAVSGTVLYLDAEDRLQAKSFRGEGACSSQVHEDCRCEASCRLAERPTASIRPDGLSVALPLEFTLEIRQQNAWKHLCGGTLEQKAPTPHPSVIVKTHAGGALWDLAKEYGATVEDIRAANGLEADAAPEDTLLLIPLR